MARPREFDIDDALEDALDVFWRYGYGETKLPDLLKGMKLSRGSFYKAFKDKKSLFLMVLSKYDTQEVSRAVDFIEQSSDSPKKQILKVFESLVQLVAENNRRGCLLCTTLAENEINDPDIERVAMASLARMEQSFQKMLEQELPNETALALAHLLTTQYLGMRLLTRTQIPAENLQQNVLAIKHMLNL